LAEVGVDLDGVTYLVGRNGAGKSTLLSALAVFFKQLSIGGPDDFTLRDSSLPIEISLTFGDLGTEATGEFGRYVRDGHLTVTKRVACDGGRTLEAYHGTSLALPEFRPIRAQSGQARIDAFRAMQQAYQMNPVRSAADVDAALARWEIEHEDQLELLEDDGQFFGYTNVGTGKLNKYIDFVLVPAVRDASLDAAEGGRDSALRHLVDVVVRRAADLAAPMTELRQSVVRAYEEIVQRPELDLGSLSERVNRAMGRFAPGALVTIAWDPVLDPRLPDLVATAKLVDDGFSGDVATKGHGLQRAYIMATLQALAEIEMANRTRGTDEDPRCGLLLAVEEPELYQHPSQARQIARTFRELADAPGSRVQIVACTHSPLFLDVRAFNAVRVVRKRVPPAGDRCTRIAHASLASVAARLQADHADGRHFSAEGLRPGLVSLLNPYVAEAFFADFVVLVEGEEDKALLEAGLLRSGSADELRRWAFVVVPVGGKKNLDKMQAILLELDIPYYLTFDCDGERNEAEEEVRRWNVVLQRMAGVPEPVPMPTTFIEPHLAVFAPNVTDAIRHEFGDDTWYELRDAACQSLGIEARRDVTKNPEVVAAMLALADGRDLVSPLLDRWATAVVEAVRSTLGAAPPAADETDRGHDPGALTGDLEEAARPTPTARDG
jgi:energy-coupling factor transporter ATP-binding protein EcfA2